MNITDILEVKANPKIPALTPGDTVRVKQKVVEGEKSRTQVFQGVVIRVRHGGAGANFTVRRVAYGVGVERTFPIYSPLVEGVEVIRHGKVRRAKLYYLRGLSTRASRIKERKIERLAEAVVTAEEKAKEEAAQIAAAEEAAQAQAAEQPEAQTQETPKAKAPKVETPKKEAPKAEASKAESPKDKAPQVKAPRAETTAEAPGTKEEGKS